MCPIRFFINIQEDSNCDGRQYSQYLFTFRVDVTFLPLSFIRIIATFSNSDTNHSNFPYILCVIKYAKSVIRYKVMLIIYDDILCFIILITIIDFTHIYVH